MRVCHGYDVAHITALRDFLIKETLVGNTHFRSLIINIHLLEEQLRNFCYYGDWHKLTINN